MKCKNCGFDLDEGALFCRKCGTAVPKTPEQPEKKRGLQIPDLSGLLKNRRLLLIAACAALAILLIVVIVCATSCGKRTTRYDTADEVFEAAIDALKRGDGEQLYAMTTLSETILGEHPETFGEGDSPAAVMKGYYRRLAGDFRTQMTERFGKDAALVPQLTETTHTGAEIYETNRALGLEAEEYVSADGILSVNGETAAELYLVAVKLDRGWKLLVLYLD